MPTVKVKYTPTGGADGGVSVYYQIYHDHRTCRVAAPGRDRIHKDLEIFGRIIRRYESIGIGFDPRDIAEAYRRYIRDYSLFGFMQGVIDRLRRDGRQRTAEIYDATLRSFVRFRDSRDVILDSLTGEMVESYAAWLKVRGAAPNTVSFYMRTLRAVYNRAVGEGEIEDRRPFRHVYTGIGKTTKRALPLDQIRRIRDLDLHASPRLRYARDLFMLSFYLRGMSFVDMCYLKKSELQGGCIVYRRRKTGQCLAIRWTTEMQAILNRYPDNNGAYLLPIIPAGVADERRAYLRAAYNLNRNLKKVGLRAGVTIPLTMYVARHSWASAARNADIPLSVISAGMGHDSEETTRIYLASLDNTAVDDANTRIIDLLG